ncbi:uncharacterized protein [Diadema antillarum]|uniref:uncharacterized protein n=1 Tax=Diadema antillarum TaxID=105358 RepID=UPI003A880CD3
MSAKANVEDIQWSRQAYTLRQAIKRCTFPQLIKVVQGYESSDDSETLALGQVLRINQIHTQTRVLATTDKKGRWLSIPLRYAEARFEVVSGKRSKPMYMREIIDKSLLPQKVQFYTGDDLTFNVQLKGSPNNAKEKFGTLHLQKMYETAYLQGNAIHNNCLDTMVVNIPLHSPVEVVLAESFIVGSRDRWERYQTLLDKIVSKNVSFELHPGNPHITYFTDKKLESADLQEHYEEITPVGTVFVSSKNSSLRPSKSAVLAGPSGARTMSAATSARKRSPEVGIDRDNASVQAGDRPTRPIMRHSQSEQGNMSSFVSSRPRLQSPNRSPQKQPVSSVHATMPRSILKKKLSSPPEERFPPPPADFLSPSSNTVQNPMAYIHSNRPQSPPPQQGVRRRTSQSPGRTAVSAKSPIRADFPRPVNQTVNNVSPGGSASSRNSSADSGYSTNSSVDNRPSPSSNPFLGALPEPDYPGEQNRQLNGQGFDGTDGSPRNVPQPPAPPPVDTIPTKQGLPNGGPKIPGPPPPPPIGFVPQPPKYNEVDAIKANQSPRQNLPSKPPLQKENSRDDMLQELKMRAERRLSRINEGGVAPNFPKSTFGRKTSPRPPNNNPPQDNNNQSKSELQELLAKRKLMNKEEGSASTIKGPPTPAAKPSPRQSNSNTPPVAPKTGGFRASPRGGDVTFSTLSDVPKDLSVLSVAQVCQCLKLMSLDKYDNAFKSNSVDGQLMLQLSKEALKESFKMSDWDAQRVESFIKGWRPKYD